jgi:uncharacterized protein YneF (UPF0154 family)
MFKKKISGPVAVVLTVLIGGAVIGFFYNQYKDPPQVSPEETRRMMSGAGKQH